MKMPSKTNRKTRHTLKDYLMDNVPTEMLRRFRKEGCSIFIGFSPLSGKEEILKLFHRYLPDISAVLETQMQEDGVSACLVTHLLQHPEILKTQTLTLFLYEVTCHAITLLADEIVQERDLEELKNA
jgi:hypothetical protein